MGRFWRNHAEAHPRSRGENAGADTEQPITTGSSPLTRGKPVSAILGEMGCAAHPRSRGENGGRVAGLRGLRGSSPLTRGKLISVVRVSPIPRLIPAHAGKTKRLDHCLSYFSAHPRSRGENANVGFTAATRAGSSPLTRGKRRRPDFRRAPGRLIPAHAGKTRDRRRPCHRRRAHPRSRGENVDRAVRNSASAGSSPLTRGKLAACQDQRSVFGLIPAHAGKT